jgi:hypothetical protein
VTNNWGHVLYLEKKRKKRRKKYIEGRIGGDKKNEIHLRGRLIKLIKLNLQPQTKLSTSKLKVARNNIANVPKSIIL